MARMLAVQRDEARVRSGWRHRVDANHGIGLVLIDDGANLSTRCICNRVGLLIDTVVVDSVSSILNKRASEF